MAGYPAYVRLKDGSKVLVQNEEEEKAVTGKADATANAGVPEEQEPEGVELDIPSRPVKSVARKK